MGNGRTNRLQKRLAEVRPCHVCAPNDGRWREGEGGLERCTCLRGQLYTKLDQLSRRRPPEVPSISLSLFQ